jgi:hypothetical protein
MAETKHADPFVSKQGNGHSEIQVWFVAEHLVDVHVVRV